MNAEQRGLDWGFCKQALQRHSRTFALPISMLPDGLERTVTCAYLLCRIADTVEDTPDWSESAKEQLFRLFLGTLDGLVEPSEFEQAVKSAGGQPEERELLLGTGRVYRVFEDTPAELRQICCDWMNELTRGMAIYSRRRPGADGVRCLLSEDDLDRYCYFVAGAIGHLLTEAFLAEMPEIENTGLNRLREKAEQFGAGLQMVNILRDIRGDLERDTCFIPRTILGAAGLGPRDLALSDRSVAARRALTPLFDKAQTKLDDALEYSLAIPKAHTAIRHFCLVPLWLAVASLRLCRDDPRLLSGTEKVKLARDEVQRLIQQCVVLSNDDEALRRAYRALVQSEHADAAVG